MRCFSFFHSRYARRRSPCSNTALLGRLSSLGCDTGPLGPHLETLATILHQHGYTRNSIRGYLRACAQFGRWLARQGYTIADVEATLVTRYLRSLPPPPVGRSPKAAAGLPHLLTLWQQQGLLPPAGQPPLHTAAAHWLEQYTQYLEHVCGAAASTRTRYRRIITRFLSACGGTGPQGWSTLQAQEHYGVYPSGSRYDSQGAGREIAQRCRPLLPPISCGVWSAVAWSGSGRSHPAAMDACHASPALDCRGGGPRPGDLDRRDPEGPAQSCPAVAARAVRAPCP